MISLVETREHRAFFTTRPTIVQSDGSPRNMNSTKTSSQGPNPEEASRNLVSIRPFFIVKDLQASIAYY